MLGPGSWTGLEHVAPVGLPWQPLFQVDDAMLMFDKTTNRHRGEWVSPPPTALLSSILGCGGLRSARGPAGHSCPFISPPDIPAWGSASPPGPGLTEGFCPSVSCARNLPT